MRFTKYNSLNDILSYPDMQKYLKIFYSEYLLDMYPKEMAMEPLALSEHFGKTPWEEPFHIVADQLLDAANVILDFTENHSRACIPLWKSEQGRWTLEDEEKGDKNQVFLLAPVQTDQKKKPAVIICPGGGYEEVCFSGEGNPILNYMEAQGYRAFILRYRVAPNRYPKPQMDLALAIQYLRGNAEQYAIDPGDIMVLGASAGGHLCASEAALHEEIAELVKEETAKEDPDRSKKYEKIKASPDKVCLCYPVISFCKEPHEGSFRALTGTNESLRTSLSVENLILSSFPKTFVWACEDDDCVPVSNAKLMSETLKKKGVECKLCIYPGGGHGCGLAFSKKAWSWSREMIIWMKGETSGIRQD